MDSVNQITEIYDRQTRIGSYADKSAIVIGLGGVGSWLALDLALVGVGTLILIDPDKIESSNLNRTLFKISQIDSNKTTAIKDLILERRPDCILVTIEDYFQSGILGKYKTDYIFDCTDNLASRQLVKEYFDLNNENEPPDYCKCGYDGFQATLSVNDFKSGRWGDDGSYTEVPSFFGTPQILSAMAVIELLMVNDKKSGSTNFNVKKILSKIKEKL